MKNHVKILLVAAVCCLGLSNTYAQRRYYNDRSGNVSSYLDLHLGEGIGRGAKALGGATVAFLYQFSPALEFGVGGGVDYIHALSSIINENKDKQFDYHGELTLPLFLRGRYAVGDRGSYYDRGSHYFLQFDLGTRVGLSAYNSGKENGIKNVHKNFEKCNVKGFFFEPQIGIAPNEVLSFSLGFPIQHYLRNSYSVSTGAEDLKTKSLMYLGCDLHVMIGF